MSDEDRISILIVDDNKNNLFTLRALIEEYHIPAHILEANSGAETLRILMKKTVDLIILDVQMADMDGFETAALIRSRKKLHDIPIVFLTAAYKSEVFQKKGLKLGAIDYLTKPIETSLLINKLRTYVRFLERRLEHKIQEQTKISEKTKSTNLAKCQSSTDNNHKFIISRERFDEVILAHSQWKRRLKKAIETGVSDLNPQEAKDYHNCSFGQWLYSKDSKKLPHHLELLEMHRKFHEEAAMILQLALQGAKVEAMERVALGSQFNQLTAKLVNKLAEIRDSLPKTSA
jgi:CheY-like chemotaxis protein